MLLVTTSIKETVLKRMHCILHVIMMGGRKLGEGGGGEGEGEGSEEYFIFKCLINIYIYCNKQ